MRGVSLVMVLALLAGAAPARAAGRSSPRPAAGTAITFATSETALDAGAVETAFQLFDLRDLWVRVRVQKVARPLRLDLRFTSPQGAVLYETQRYFSRQPKATTMRSSGAKHGITVFPAKKLTSGFALDQPIPVAGGVLQRFPHAGTWRVEAQLQDTGEIVSAPLVIRVTP